MIAPSAKVKFPLQNPKMLKRKGAADVLADVDESKKAKPDPPNGDLTDDKSHKPTVETRKAETPGPEDAPKYMQIIITGPQKCGKSCLVLSYVGQLFPSRQTEFLSKQYLHILPENNQSVMIWDLDARNEFTEYRRQSYKEADAALLCFNVRVPKDSPAGSEHRLENLLHPWITELDNNCENMPVILVGLKGDLKMKSEWDFYSADEIKKVMRRYPRIVLYKEVSAYTDKEGVKELFASAISCIKKPKPKIMFTNCGFGILSNRWLL